MDVGVIPLTHNAKSVDVRATRWPAALPMKQLTSGLEHTYQENWPYYPLRRLMPDGECSRQSHAYIRRVGDAKRKAPLRDVSGCHREPASISFKRAVVATISASRAVADQREGLDRADYEHDRPLRRRSGGRKMGQ